MSVEADLVAEIEKWSKRLDNSLLSAHPSDEKGAKILQNIKAYRNDSKHFIERGDMIKSFECLVWAWALLETGKELGHLR
ncbi:MAG TPA: DUF357 domain-containing protein [Hadesarchaea archaeon]|nr:DUF357 domain-containing protein [Hadesarchaea archaeon]